METKKQGFSIDIEKTDTAIFMSLTATGKLTHADYEILTPMIDSALNDVKQIQVNVLVDMTAFAGWELRAAWDDLQLGLKHGKEFTKVAIVGNKTWQSISATIGNWFISGEAQFFENSDDALTWLNS